MTTKKKSFSVETIFSALDRVTPSMRRMATGVSAFSKSAEKNLKSVDKALSKVAAPMMAGLKQAAVVAGAGVAAGLTSSIIKGSEFEAVLSNVGAASHASALDMDRLSAKAKQLGSTTKFSAAQVGGAMEIMAKAGYGVEDVLGNVGAVLSAAAADGASIEDTASSIMSSLKSLNLGPEKMQAFADMAAKAGDATSASIGSIAESMSVFGGVADKLNIPLESAIAQLALLQDAGIDASSAGTTLAAMYSKLAAPTKRTSDELAKLGVTVTDVMGNMKPPDKLLSELLAATSKIQGNAGKMAAVTNLVGLESQKALLNIASAAGDGRLGTLTEALKTAEQEGYAAEIAAKKMNNFRGDLTLLGSAVDGLQIDLFDLNKGPLREVVQGMTKWLGDNKDQIIQKMGVAIQFVGTVAMLVADNFDRIVYWGEKLATLGAIFLTIAGAVKVATAAAAAFNVVAAMNPYVLIGIAIVAAIALIITFWDEIKQAAAKLQDWLFDIGESIVRFFGAIWESQKAVAAAAWDFILSLASAYVGMLTAVWGGIVSAFTWVWETVKGAFVGAWEFIVAIGQAYVEMFTGAWSGITSFFDSLWAGVKAGFDFVFGPIIAAIEWAIGKLGELTGFELPGWLGGGGDSEAASSSGEGPSAPLSTGAAQLTRSESEHTNHSVLTVRDETRRAVVTKAPPRGGARLVLQPSGGL